MPRNGKLVRIILALTAVAALYTFLNLTFIGKAILATYANRETAQLLGINVKRIDVVTYGLGTALLQLGYQHGGALTVAGLATLLTNALPIAAGTVVLGEPVPTGPLGVLRVFAFVAVTIGAILLARRSRS